VPLKGGPPGFCPGLGARESSAACAARLYHRGVVGGGLGPADSG
jgi:hypothetical protein